MKPWIQDNRQLLATACLALSSGFLILTDHFQGPQLGAAWIFLGLGWKFSKSKSIGNPWVFGSLVVLLGFAYFSVLGSILWGYGNWEQTLSLAIWMTPLLVFYLIDIDKTLLKWWLPLIVVHALLILGEGIVLGQLRASGLTVNPGVAGAILVVGILILVLDSPRKWKLLIPLFLIALLLTGSRLPLIVFIMLSLGLLIVGGLKGTKIYLRNNPILIGVSLIPILLVILNPSIIPYSLRLNATYPSTISEDLESRVEITHPISVVPQGYFHSGGLHSLPIKVAAQMGIPAAVLLVLLTLWSLTRRPLFTSDWWILMSLVLMSILELYTWLGPLSVVWWLTIGWRTKHGSGDSPVLREPDDSLEEKILSKV